MADRLEIGRGLEEDHLPGAEALDELDPVADAELLVDVMDVVLDGVVRDEELGGDPLLRQSGELQPLTYCRAEGLSLTVK